MRDLVELPLCNHLRSSRVVRWEGVVRSTWLGNMAIRLIQEGRKPHLQVRRSGTFLIARLDDSAVSSFHPRIRGLQPPRYAIVVCHQTALGPPVEWGFRIAISGLLS